MTAQVESRKLGGSDEARQRKASRKADRALVRECLAERPGAWERLVERFTPVIAVVARRTLRGRALSPRDEDIEDICENTLLAIVKDGYKLLGDYDDTYALSTFIGVIARTHAGRYVRRKRHATCDIDAIEVGTGADDDPADLCAREGLCALVRKGLQKLAPRDAEILKLFYFSNLDYQGIARAIGVKPNSVGAALHRARERLGRLLAIEGV